MKFDNLKIEREELIELMKLSEKIGRYNKMISLEKDLDKSHIYREILIQITDKRISLLEKLGF
ncbi:hypothetical protein [Methanobrevibacter curvatus]|uniref:Uncharacterized protein n=1 Tax=Methanobrevibacter curvatus TaxID=49547 RepID=A0A166CAN4_9EURY|nr:hypothetical protein [Methanobrevibacter curvatus]KZX14306.1 hypothetical protein MBCUR_05300 [Methanobrevibacter curvatus]